MKKTYIIIGIAILFIVLSAITSKHEVTINKKLEDLGFVSHDGIIYTMIEKNSITEIDLKNNICVSNKSNYKSELEIDNEIDLYYNFINKKAYAINTVYSYGEYERLFSINYYDEKSDNLVMNNQIQEFVYKCKDYIGDYQPEEAKTINQNKIEFNDFKNEKLIEFINYSEIERKITSFSFDLSNTNKLYMLAETNKIFRADLNDNSYTSKILFGQEIKYINNNNLIYDNYYVPINSESNVYNYGCLNCDNNLSFTFDNKKEYTSNCTNLDELEYHYINDEYFEILFNDLTLIVDSENGSFVKLSLLENEKILSINNSIIKTNYAFYDINGNKLEDVSMIYDNILDIASYKNNLYLLGRDNIIYKYVSI